MDKIEEQVFSEIDLVEQANEIDYSLYGDIENALLSCSQEENIIDFDPQVLKEISNLNEDIVPASPFSDNSASVDQSFDEDEDLVLALDKLVEDIDDHSTVDREQKTNTKSRRRHLTSHKQMYSPRQNFVLRRLQQAKLRQLKRMKCNLNCNK